MQAPPIDKAAAARLKLVDDLRQLANIRELSVLAAFRAVPRHIFVPEAEQAASYEDRALPLAEEQTISQPSMVAIMLEELAPQPSDRALEVGTGSGYAAALLGQLVQEVHGIELRPVLAAQAALRLKQLSIHNVHIHLGDGILGYPPSAPYDRILVSARAANVPSGLLAQLSPGGKIVIPVGSSARQLLMVGTKAPDGQMSWRASTPCFFVPLIGAIAS